MGKGDPKSRLIALKKEMDVMKRNHDLFIDEMKRDYGEYLRYIFLLQVFISLIA